MNLHVKVPIEVSARHVHLCQEHVEALFGAGYELTAKRELSQKGYYVAAEKIQVIGEKSSAPFSILTPLRQKTQVEVSMTDARTLGIKPIVRLSGDLKGSAKVRLKGPVGELLLEEGAIVAKRHIHMSDSLAQKLGLERGNEVSVEVSGQRGGTFEHVALSIDPSFDLTMHIDTDEGNAFGIAPESYGFIKF